MARVWFLDFSGILLTSRAILYDRFEKIYEAAMRRFPQEQMGTGAVAGDMTLEVQCVYTKKGVKARNDGDGEGTDGEDEEE